MQSETMNMINGRTLSKSGIAAGLLSLLLVSIAAWGCAESNAGDTAASPWNVPELKERAPGLDAGDFGIVKRQAESFRSVLKSDPGNLKGLVGLAQIFMYEARVTGDHPYYYAAAQDLLGRAVAAHPDDYQAVISSASVLLSLHRFGEALPLAQKAVALAPEAAAGYGALADAYVELGQYGEAVKAADRMTALRPDLKSYSRVSYLREIHGDMQGGKEAMKLAVSAGAPGSEEKAWTQTALGNLYLEEGKVESAEREFRMAALERRNYPFALAGLARVRLAQGSEGEALALLDSAIALAAEFSFVELKAEILRAAGNAAAADSLVAEVRTMLAEDEASGHRMDRETALLLVAHGIGTEEAVARARAELERRPDNIDAQHAMAYVLFRAGEMEEAKLYMDRALRLGTRNATLTAHAALIEEGLGNRRQADRLAQRLKGRSAALSSLLKKAMEEKWEL